MIKTTLVSAIVASLAIAATPLMAESAKPYDYGTMGPEKWGQLHPDFATCEKGDMQSPIDLAGANAKAAVEYTVNYLPGPLTVSNKGLTIQADFAPGSSLTSGGTKFDLIQIHFHTPSEHAIAGKRYPLTGHFVHASADGRLAVLGVMFEEGAANAELAKILAATPDQKSEPKAVAGQSIDPNRLLPTDRAIYRYMGSLTTPPCSEGVNWHVLSQPLTASEEQIEQFGELMGSNARPIRAINNRLVIAPK